MASMVCWEELVRSMALPALILDDSHKVILTNFIEASAFKLSGPSALGKTLFDFLPGDQANLLHDSCLKAIASKEPVTHRVQMESPDGFIKPIARLIPLFNPDSMSWNLILTLQEKPDGGGELVAAKSAEEGRPEQNKAEANGTGEAKEFKAALRLLLKEGATQLAELKDEISSKLPHEILLMVEALKKTKLNKTQRTYVELLESNTRKLTEPFARRIASPVYKLSPKEVKVACLIKDGLTNKEIAKLLKLAKSTILTHRHHVRTKLGLKNKKQNLQSYLNSFGSQPPSDSPPAAFITTAL